MHDDGRPYGWRGLLPYVRNTDYRRTSSIELRPDGLGAGAAGAFSRLLQTYLALAEWIAERVKGKRISLQQISTDRGLRTRLPGLKHLHSDFLRQCRSLGLTARDYPFNTEQLGIRSLSAAVRAECLRSFVRGARLAGATNLKGMPTDADAVPADDDCRSERANHIARALRSIVTLPWYRQAFDKPSRCLVGIL